MVEFTCGGTPAYNGYVAELKGSELVVSLHTATDGANDDKRTEVKRVAVSGSTLAAAPFAAK
jgi:hypothetical protein